MGSFKEWRRDLNDPRRGEEGIAWANAVGPIQDRELELLRVAALSRLPRYCPDDGLDLLGRAFKLPRLPGQSDASYRATLARAIPIYSLGGSPEAIIESLRAYGLGDVEVYAACDLAFLPASPINYDPGRSPPWYSAFLVVLGPDFGTTGIGPQLAPFLGGPECTSGSTATRTQVRAICNTILRWKSAESYPVGVVLRFGTTALGGIDTIAPFTPSATPQYCFWNIGKLQGVNVFTAPWTPGGYSF